MQTRQTLSTRSWVLILSAAFVLLAALALYFHTRGAGGRVAQIQVDGEVIRTVDLSSVTEEYTFTVETAHGLNEIAVRPGGICVRSADCPDQVCVRRGWLTGGRMPVVCLPHGLVITLVSGGQALDAVSG